MGMIPRSPDVPIGADEDRRHGPASYSSDRDRERRTRDEYQGVRDGAGAAMGCVVAMQQRAALAVHGCSRAQATDYGH